MKPAVIWGCRFFFGAVGLGIIGFFYLSYSQYLGWLDAGPPASYLIPPYQNIWYLFSYIISHYAYHYIISLGVAFLFLGIAILLDERFGRRFFKDEEPYLGALFIFILGNPLWIYYLGTVFGIGLLVTGYRLLVTKRFERFSLYSLWLPIAILVIILSRIL